MSAKKLFKISAELQEIMPGYLQNRVKDIVTLEAAVAKCDFHTLNTIGHKIKGTAGGYGLDPLSSIGAEIEVAGKTQDLALGQTKVGEMKAFLENLEIEFDESI
jgi:HPt (histidine-containing phosphotransfer) domain-containing protein